jgi:hypothetical protein
VDFVFQFISIAPVVEDLIPGRDFLLTEAGPFNNENSSSLFLAKPRLPEPSGKKRPILPVCNEGVWSDVSKNHLPGDPRTNSNQATG